MQLPYDRIGSGLLFAALMIASPLLIAADRLLTGEWEFTNSSGRDSYTFKKCLKASDAAQVNGAAATARAAMEQDAAGRCTVESFAVAEDTVDYVLVCGAQRIKSTTTYHGDRSEATITVSNDSGETTSTVKGQRTGACRP